MLQSPTKSLRKLAQQTDISYSIAQKALKNEFNLHPYKVTVVHELKPADFDKRVQYCDWFHRMIQRHSVKVLDRIFYTDETWFHLSGYVNSQNTRIW